jgi:hypothetical protein
MPVYAVIRKSDQVEVLRYSAAVPQEVNGFDLIDYDHNELDPGAPPPPPVFEWERLVFLRRFSAQERIAIRAARTTDPILDDFFNLLEHAKTVHSNDPDMIAGMGYLVYKGLVTAERRDAILGSA